MNTYHLNFSSIVLIAALALSQTSAAEPIQFIPATPVNTTLLDGSQVNTKEGTGDWKWLPNQGNQGIFESYGDPKRNAPGLVIHAKDLEAGRDYEVFGFFWAHGFSTDPAARGMQPHHWPARFGVGLASLTTYGGRLSQDIPWIISPESKSGIHFGYTAVLEEKNPLVRDVPNWITALDDIRMVRARVGISRADKLGNIPVYADDFPDSKYCGHTRIDGIGLRLLPAGDYDTAGAGKPGQLHLAVRAGDHRNMRRELAAGADVNALDEDGVTPLLYPATSGDQDTVRELLKAGANPSQPGQSILPLTGAASWGDAEMVKLLLDAGAVVPLKLETRSPLLDEMLDPGRLHPAVAAIRAGSLGCLKLILVKQPSLDVMSLAPENQPNIQHGTWKTPDDMVLDAIRIRHDELAAFLIERGCKVKDPEIIADCISYGDEMAKTREALLRHGIPAIQPIPYNRYSGEYANENFVSPWDALSAAVFKGDVNLTKRFLILAKDVDKRYQLALHALAATCGESEVRKAVYSVFPAPPVMAKELHSHEETDHNKEEVRLFLPRIGARTKPEALKSGKWNLAVMSSSEASGPASLVEARASINNYWQVLDRSQIDAALHEDRTAKPWENGEHRLAELGDRLTADMILVATKLSGGGIQLIRFEAVDVVSALVVHREYREEKSLSETKVVDQLLTAMGVAMEKARSSKRPLAVSLLTFTAEENLPSSNMLAIQFRSAMEIEVDGTSGLLSVGMNEINSIASEQALRGEASFWAAAYTLEGGIASMPDARVSLTLRLRNLTGNSERSTDVTVEGPSLEITDLASRAWRQLVETCELRSEIKTQAKQDPKWAAIEAARLAREAEWLILSKKPKEARPLAERALVLGAEPGTIIPVILACYLSEIPLPSKFFMDHSDFRYEIPTWIVPSSHYQNKLTQHIKYISELAELLDFYNYKYGEKLFEAEKHKMATFTTLKLLCYLRSIFQEMKLDNRNSTIRDNIGSTIDKIIPIYFDNLLKVSIKNKYIRNEKALLFHERDSFLVLSQNPNIAEGLCSIFLSSINERSILFYNLLHISSSGSCDSVKSAEIVATKMEEMMNILPAEYAQIIDNQISFIRSRGDATSILARSHQKRFLSIGRRDITQLYCSFIDDRRYGTREFFKMKNEGTPPSSRLILHSLLHKPEDCPECITRSGYYFNDKLNFHYTINMMENSLNLRLHLKSARDSLIQGGLKDLAKAHGEESLKKIMSKHVVNFSYLDVMYGLNVFDPIKNEWDNLNKSHDDIAAIRPRMLADLRNGSNSDAGIIDIWLPDTTESARLWVRYRPHTGGFCRTNGTTTWNKNIKELGAWLFAVSCRTGVIELRTSLSTFEELKDSKFLSVPKIGFKSPFIIQNSSMVLTHVEWKNSTASEEWSGVPGDWSGAYALIDKESGRTRRLIKGVHIKTLDIYPSHQNACVEVIEDQFYALAHSEPKGGNFVKYQLLHIDHNGESEYLTKINRRPELTPFDVSDKSPFGMVKNNHQLLIYDKDFMNLAQYEPVGKNWTIIKGESRGNKDKIVESMSKSVIEKQSQTHGVVMPDGMNILKIRGGANTWPNAPAFNPSSFAVDIPGRNNVLVPLCFDFPGSYTRVARFLDEGFTMNNKLVPDIISTVNQLNFKKRLYPLVINQTDKDIIIGLSIKPLDRSRYDSNHACLPFLWALPKEELFQYLGITDPK